MQTPTDEKPENTIVAELQKGYKLGDKVLRPTLVNVATAPQNEYKERIAELWQIIMKYQAQKKTLAKMK